ncbi:MULTISPECIES: hypothetical protein [Oceanobacillus]|uniref:Uncharacterized protein n=1 Tax=Oceanobacillus indicireducens TaxID=1004261 RepID=A0A917XTI7_9BACI|nr:MULTISPECIES: hypothetical protein [Oceanobacillus]GGN51730.1 hypothetical protein GCM10007971_06520 [Oceanobacillus indicireducens]
MAQQQKNKESYVEVIGDTVYGKHLIATISLSISLSLIGFFIGKQIFPHIAPEQMVKSYSLLLGIAGSLIALLINTLLFKPKRILNETPNTSAELTAVYQKLQFDIEEEREAILNDPVTAQEMKEQGIYDMFMEEKREEH